MGEQKPKHLNQTAQGRIEKNAKTPVRTSPRLQAQIELNKELELKEKQKEQQRTTNELSQF